MQSYLEMKHNDRKRSLVKDRRHHHTRLLSQCFALSRRETSHGFCPTDSSHSKISLCTSTRSLVDVCFFSFKFLSQMPIRRKFVKKSNFSRSSRHEGRKWAWIWWRNIWIVCLIAAARELSAKFYLTRTHTKRLIDGDWRHRHET